MYGYGLSWDGGHANPKVDGEVIGGAWRKGGVVAAQAGVGCAVKQQCASPIGYK